jgi:catechol 2,3-dioxygenase-like lactoylglutathione lyase family enzyme
MARKKLIRSLPPLRAVPALKATHHKEARLLEIMRGIAINNQLDEPQVFYPMREVAAHFRVPVSLVARVYAKLEDEGILSSVRGSKTLLQGLSSGRHFSVLGFVGMPAATSSFVPFQDYRTFFIRMRRELRNQGFAVATVFFYPSDLKSGKLVERIDKYDFDTLIWFRPDVSMRETLRRLKDKGIHILGVADGGVSPVRCRYEVHRETAITTILRDWHIKSRGKPVVIVRGIKHSAAEDEILEALIQSEGLDHEVKSIGTQRPELFLEALGKTENARIIFPSWAAAFFAFRAPEDLFKLSNRCRVAFTGGPVSIPFAPLPEVRVDLVVVDWQLVAEQIVTDLVRGTAFDQVQTTVCEAQAVLRAPLNQYAETL